MSTMTEAPGTRETDAQKVGFGRIMLSEWTKLRSVRSTVWSFIIMIILNLGLTALIVGLVAAQWDKSSPGDRAQIVADPTGWILGDGQAFSQLAICVLGIM